MNKDYSIDQIIRTLKIHSNPKNVEGMARFGINPQNTLGISIPFLRNLAKKIGKNHQLAQNLWNTKIHEARILAAFIDTPKDVTENQLESWVKDFDSWDVCDQVCSGLFDKTPWAYTKALEWTERKEEFVKRAGFVLMASLSVHDKKATADKFMRFFTPIKKHSTDERNFVKKAVNWALRQIGKRNKTLRKQSIEVAKQIEKIDSKSARWIAKDALRELTRNEKVVQKQAL